MRSSQGLAHHRRTCLRLPSPLVLWQEMQDGATITGLSLKYSAANITISDHIKKVASEEDYKRVIEKNVKDNQIAGGHKRTTSRRLKKVRCACGMMMFDDEADIPKYISPKNRAAMLHDGSGMCLYCRQEREHDQR